MELKDTLKSFLQKERNPMLVILGPTASGKTALSLKIAKEINGEIISTDSRQIYRYMDIGTDSLPLEQQEGVPHHLLGITDPDKTLTLTEYREFAEEKITEIRSRNHIPMLVGGTGLYISALIENYAMPHIPPDPNFREELENKAQIEGVEAVYALLEEMDPQKAKSIHANNLRYVIRAIEVAKASKKAQTPTKSSVASNVFMIGINWPRKELYERVELRVDKQIERGLVNEVKSLMEKGYSESLPAMSSLGVKEILPYLKDEMPLAECIEILKRNTRRYAKRQMTWFRRFNSIHWISPGELNHFLSN